MHYAKWIPPEAIESFWAAYCKCGTKRANHNQMITAVKDNDKSVQVFFKCPYRQGFFDYSETFNERHDL